MDVAALAAVPGLELSIVSVEAAGAGRWPMPYRLHVVDGRIVDGGEDPDLAAHVTATLARGIALLGPPPEEVLVAPPWPVFLQSIVDDLDWGMERIHERPGYAVLNGARVVLTLQSPAGTVLGKEEAAALALERFPREHHPLLEQAVAERLGAAVEWDPEALRRYRTFVVGAAVRRRPGRKVAGLP